MMWINKHIYTIVLITALSYSAVECSCDILSRVTHQDHGINITSNTDPCELNLRSTSEKQVVAALYDLKPDCGVPNGKGNINIYDGTDSNMTLLVSSCRVFGRDVSYASRKNSLTIRLHLPFKPFKVNVYSLGTVKTYTVPTGKIKSERFPGFMSGVHIFTTPNNFHSFYNIMADGNATIHIQFKEFNIDSGIDGGCPDFVKLHGITPSPLMCSTHKLPTNVSTVTDLLSIEFQTDNLYTYTGFTAEYVACFERRTGSNKTEEFHFPLFPPEEEMRCFLDINFQESSRIMISVTIQSNITDKKCKDIIRLVADGIDVTDAHLLECKVNTVLHLEVTINSSLRILFTSKSKYENVTGYYTTETPANDTPTSSLPSFPTATSKSISTVVTSIVLPVTTVLILAMVVVVVVLYKRGVIAIKLQWKKERTYENRSQKELEHQYTNPSTFGREQEDNTATYKNEKFPRNKNQKGGIDVAYQNVKYRGEGKSSDDKNYYNLDANEGCRCKTAGNIVTIENQYEEHLAHDIPENDHQYSKLN